MVKVKIINKPITPFISDDSRKQDGAELIFNGRVRNTENGKEIKSFSILPCMGVCLSEKTNVNLNFLKNCFYVEIIFEDKLKSVENIKKDTIYKK